MSDWNEFDIYENIASTPNESEREILYDAYGVDEPVKDEIEKIAKQQHSSGGGGSSKSSGGGCSEFLIIMLIAFVLEFLLKGCAG